MAIARTLGSRYSNIQRSAADSSKKAKHANNSGQLRPKQPVFGWSFRRCGHNEALLDFISKHPLRYSQERALKGEKQHVEKKAFSQKITKVIVYAFSQCKVRPRFAGALLEELDAALRASPKCLRAQPNRQAHT